MLRSHAELVAVEAANPFGDTSGVHVVFLERAPSNSAVASTRSRSLARATPSRSRAARSTSGCRPAPAGRS